MKNLIFFIFTILLPTTVLNASNLEFEKNFNLSIEKNLKTDKIKILSKDPIKSLKGLNLVIFENKKINDIGAVLASDDGKTIFDFPNFITFSNQSDEAMVNKKIENLKSTRLKNQQAEILEILKTIPKERFINIESFYKNNPKTIYIITDPECPYCQEDMSKIVKWLRNAHVKIIFAPVHGKSAYTKSAIMLRKAGKIKPDNQEKIIKIIEKYYDKKLVVKDNQASDEERNLVLQDVKKLFSKGVVKGVPFHVETENR